MFGQHCDWIRCEISSLIAHVACVQACVQDQSAEAVQAPDAAQSATPRRNPLKIAALHDARRYVKQCSGPAWRNTTATPPMAKDEGTCKNSSLCAVPFAFCLISLLIFRLFTVVSHCRMRLSFPDSQRYALLNAASTRDDGANDRRRALAKADGNQLRLENHHLHAAYNDPHSTGFLLLTPLHVLPGVERYQHILAR